MNIVNKKVFSGIIVFFSLIAMVMFLNHSLGMYESVFIIIFGVYGAFNYNSGQLNKIKEREQKKKE